MFLRIHLKSTLWTRLLMLFNLWEIERYEDGVKKDTGRVPFQFNYNQNQVTQFNIIMLSTLLANWQVRLKKERGRKPFKDSRPKAPRWLPQWRRRFGRELGRGEFVLQYTVGSRLGGLRFSGLSRFRLFLLLNRWQIWLNIIVGMILFSGLSRFCGYFSGDRQSPLNRDTIVLPFLPSFYWLELWVIHTKWFFRAPQPTTTGLTTTRTFTCTETLPPPGAQSSGGHWHTEGRTSTYN